MGASTTSSSVSRELGSLPTLVLCNDLELASVARIGPFGLQAPLDAECIRSSGDVAPCAAGFTLPPANPFNSTLWLSVPAPANVAGIAPTAVMAASTGLPLLDSSAYAADTPLSPCPAGLYCPANFRCTIPCSAGFLCLPLTPANPNECDIGSTCPGTAWPVACPESFYCPFASSAPFPCPPGQLCPAGSASPRACPLLSICDNGGEKSRFLGLLLAGGALCCLVVLYAGFLALRQFLRSKRDKKHKREHRGSILQASQAPSSTRFEGFVQKLNMSVQISALSVFTPASVAEKGVCLLDTVSGVLKAGNVTAVMGGSGCGKSTLMNALVGKIPVPDARIPPIQFVSQSQPRDPSLVSHIGCVPQDDVMLPELTVKETLLCQAFLRCPALEVEAARLRVTAVLRDLGLYKKRHARIGDVNQRGLSGGERKRVNVAVC